MSYDITVGRESGRHLAVTTFDARPEEIGAKSGEAFGNVAAYLARRGLQIAGPAISCYAMGEGVFHVSSGFVVEGPFPSGDGVDAMQLPVVEVVTTTHIGPYEELGKAYEALRAGAREQGREVDESALMWEEYWTGPETPVAEHRTVVHWPLKPADG